MNKKALIGKLLLILLVFLVLSGVLYFNFREKNVRISAGDKVVDIKYNITSDENTEEEEENITIEIENNITEQNSTQNETE